MKIRKPSLRGSSSVRGASTEKVDGPDESMEVESVEGADPTDRFEVGSHANSHDDNEESPEETDELMEASMEDPVLYQEIARSAMLGLEELPPSVDTTWNGVATLLDTERD